MRPAARAAIPAVILISAALLQASPAQAGHPRTSIRLREVGRDPFPASGETIGRPLLSNIPASQLSRLHGSAARSGGSTLRASSGPRTPTIVTQFAGPRAGAGGTPLASPSDSSGAIGPDFIVGTVNVVVKIYDTAGVSKTAPLRLKSLFGGLSGTDTDPKVIYDPYHDEFVLAFLMFTASSSQIVVVEIPGATADDTATWCGVVLNGDQIRRNGTQVADYTQLGFSANRVTIDTNNYQASTLHYAYVQMLSFSSSQLYDCNNPNPAYKVFGGKQTRNPDGTKAFTIQPAETATDLGAHPTTQFLTSFEWRGNTHLSRMVVWRLRKNSRGKLSLTNAAVNVGTVHIPPFGTQCHGSSSLDTRWDTGDTRLVNAYYDADRQRLYTAHAVKHDFGGGNVSAVRWYEIHPAGTLKNSTILRKGFIGEDGSDAGWPSIADNADGVVFVNYNQASAANDECIGAWAATVQTGSTTPSEVEIKTGTELYDFSAGVERWGDYTQLNRDPSDTTRMGMFNAYEFDDGTPPTTTVLFQEWIAVANDV